MVREPLISDNPFRLLDLPSGESYQVLRRKADSVARSAQVGLAPDVPLAEEFGGDLDDLVSRVRSLATDPAHLTLYRIFWPLEPGQAVLISGEVAGGVGHSDLQKSFLDHWYAFLYHRRTDLVGAAIDGMAGLGQSPTFGTRLTEALANDEAMSVQSPKEVVLQAIELTNRHVAERSVAIAAAEWEAGNDEEGAAIVDAVHRIPLPEEELETVFAPLLSLGRRLTAELEQETEGLSDLIPPISIELSGKCTEIESLASAMPGFSRAYGWDDAVLEYRTVLASRFRERALVLANERDDHPGALMFVRRALEVEPEEELRSILIRDLEVLEARDVSYEQRVAWKEVRPCRAPTMYTINGFGTTIFGEHPFAGDESLKTSTLAGACRRSRSGEWASGGGGLPYSGGFVSGSFAARSRGRDSRRES